MPIKLIDNTSFGLIRTNPKLSTNVKLVVDSKSSMYLESFDANNELSKSKYKANRISNSSSYEYDLSRFYRFGDTPNDIIYDVHRKISDLNIKESYDEQFEFQYAYGTTSINSKEYNEEFGILAPIWLENIMPDYFVIFRIDEPISLNNVNVSDENFNIDLIKDPNNFKKLILEKSTMIKTFDLTENTEIGKYIRKYRKKERFPKSPLILSTEREEDTKWCGIDIKNGGFVESSEFSYDRLFGTDSTILEDDFYITNGFERNTVAVANILNLQFLFDDTDAENFTINRYFGLYVNTIKEGSFRVSGSRMFNDRFEQQLPRPINPDVVVPENTNNFVQTNDKGIKFYIEDSSIKSEYVTGDITGDLIPDLFGRDFLPKPADVMDLTSIFYIKDKDGNLHNIKADGDWLENEQIRIQKNKIDWSKFTGKGELVSFTNGRPCAQQTGSASTVLTVNSQIPHGDRYFAGIIKKQSYEFSTGNIVPGTIFTITDGVDSIQVNAVNNSPENLFQSIKLIWDNTTLINFSKFNVSIRNNKLIAVEKDESGIDIDFTVSSTGLSEFNVIKKDSSSIEPYVITADATLVLEPGQAIGRFFNPIGTVNEIASAMSKAFNNINDRLFEATSIKNKVVLVSRLGGSRFNDIAIGRDLFLEGSHVNLLSNSIGFQHPVFKINYFEGGSQDCRSRIAIDIESFDTFNINDGYVQIIDKSGTSNTLSKLEKVSYYIDEPIKNKRGEIIGYNNFDKLCTINVKDGEIIYQDIYKNIYLYRLFDIEFGRLSFFPIKDIDVDYFSTEYSNLNQLEIEKDYYDNFGTSNSIFTHNDIEEFFNTKEFSSLQGILSAENSNAETESIKIETEYDRLKENFLKDISVPSRIVPYINKWVYRNGKNIRDVDYRLSSSEAFGLTNFSPSSDEFLRDSDFFTNEWYYLQKLPWYFGLYDTINLEKTKSYFPENIDVTESGLLNIDYDYFTNYFIVDKLKYPVLDTSGVVVESEIEIPINRQIRYSVFDGGTSDNFATAFHRGIKIIVKERSENDIKPNFNLQNIKLIKNNRFNGYKFSCVLIPHNGAYPENKQRKNIEYEFIENRKYKNITLLIYININDKINESKIDIDGNISIEESSFIDYSILYSLRSKFVSINQIDLNSDSSMDYSDVFISGAIDLRLSSGTNFGTGNIIGVENSAGESTRFLSEIILNENGSFNNIIVENGPIQRQFKPVQILADDRLLIDPTSIIGGSQPIGLTSIQVEEGTYIYENGGYNFWESRLNRITFASIYDIINTGSPDVKYTTILENGLTVDDLYIIELQAANPIFKPTIYIPENDIDKPVNFNLSDIIGYQLNRSSNINVTPIYRHRGYFQPKFRDVVNYIDPYIISEFSNPLERESQIYDKIKYCNTQFKIDNNFFMLRNVYYHKVNDINQTGILELSNESAYSPLYPLIGEVAIDKRDIYMWKSNWDPGYYKKHIDKIKSIDVIGTRSTLEDKSFFASKVMKILDEFEIEDLISEQVFTINDLEENERYFQPDNDVELAYYIDDNQIILDVFLEKRIIRYLYDNGIKELFLKYVNPELSAGDVTSVSDDVESYINKNILKRYSLNGINLYTLKTLNRNLNITVPEVITTFNNAQKIETGLSINNDFNFTKLSSRSNFNLKLIYNKTRGYSYSISPSFKIIKK
jgi:hypothetical protein